MKSIPRSALNNTPVPTTLSNNQIYYENDKREKKQLTNFELWKRSLTPEDIASSRFIVLCCGCCPAYRVSCFQPDTTCKGKFLSWAHEEAFATGGDMP